MEVRELQAALKIAQRQLDEQRSLAQETEQQRQALVESLGEAVRVSEEQMAAAHELQLKLEAFGVDLFTREENSLEQRLLKAVRDLDIRQQEVDRLTASVHRLSEAFMKYLKEAPAESEEAMAEAHEAIADATRSLETPDGEAPAGPNLENGRVVSLDPEIGLVVANAGARDGLRVGTPLAIYKEERPMFSALVVDVREGICGALLQERADPGTEVEVGDRVRLLPNDTSL